MAKKKAPTKKALAASSQPSMSYGMFNSDQSTDGQQVWGPGGKPPEMDRLQIGERTGIQSVITSPWVLRWQSLPTTYNTYRLIRKDPTVALARAISAAPVLAAEWSYKRRDQVPEEVEKFIKTQMEVLRMNLLETACYFGNVDFGYQGYEKVFDYDSDGKMRIKKLKPLLHDITEIIIAPNGSFEGFKQPACWLGGQNAMLIPFRVEGSLWYGQPLLENIRETYYQWLDANDSAGRYDRKVAGGRIVIYYPPGKTMYQGTLRANHEIAQFIAQTMQSAGITAVPRDMAPFVERLAVDQPGWIIDVLDKGAGLQPQFIARLEYLDKRMVRGLLVPERMMMEGKHGTLAEAEAHADVGLNNADQTHKYITALVNFQLVDQLLVMNFGEEYRGAVWLEASPLLSDAKTFLRQVYTSVLTNPVGFQDELASMDTNAIKDTLGIPKVKEVDHQEGTVGEGETQPDGEPRVEMAPGAAATVSKDPNSAVAASIQRIYGMLGNEMRRGPAHHRRTFSLAAASVPGPLDSGLSYENDPTQPAGAVSEEGEPAEAEVNYIIDLPFVAQDDAVSCGAAAAMAVGRHFGVGPEKLEGWKKALGTVQEGATSPKSICDFLSSLGLQVDPQDGMTLEDLGAYTQAGWPVICPIQDYPTMGEGGMVENKEGHWVVVIGALPGMIFAQDSSAANPRSIEAQGKVLIREKDWYKCWHDKDTAGTEYVRFGIVVGPKEDEPTEVPE